MEHNRDQGREKYETKVSGSSGVKDDRSLYCKKTDVNLRVSRDATQKPCGDDIERLKHGAKTTSLPTYVRSHCVEVSRMELRRAE